MTMDIDLKYLSSEKDRHGNDRLYVRRNGRRIRITEKPGTPEFLDTYREALRRISPGPKAAEQDGQKWPQGSFGALAVKYFGSTEFRAINPISQRTRRLVIESCLMEPHSEDDKDPMGNCPLAYMTPKKIKRLRDLKATKPGAANNRKKYLSAMFGWAIEADLMATNPTRDVCRKKYASSGFYTWTVDDVQQYEATHAIGTTARLALALLLYVGCRRGDVVRLNESMIRDEVLTFVPNKTRHQRATETKKPVLPALRVVLDASPLGTSTFLETSFGKPFTAAGFGNKFREWCNQANLTRCSAHGLRKAGATIAAEKGATVHQLMAIYDWSTIKQAEPYTRAASQKKLAQQGMHLIQPGGLH